MSIKLKPVRDQVIVITGASSGIGLTTARMGAKRGAGLVLVARNEDALRQLEAELNRDGKRASMSLPTSAMRRLPIASPRRRLSTLAGLIRGSMAGIGIYGRLLDVTTEDHRRLFETNFWGVVYGSLKPPVTFASTVGRSSILAQKFPTAPSPSWGCTPPPNRPSKDLPTPCEWRPGGRIRAVSVTLIKPTATDTPFPDHAKNYLDEEPALPEPIYAPEIVAEVILHCADIPSAICTGVVRPRCMHWRRSSYRDSWIASWSDL